MSSKTVLVLGAAGSVGQSVAVAFARKGWRVLGLVRHGREAVLPDGVTAVTADLFDAAAVVRATGPVDIVFNGLNAPYPVWEKQLLPLFSAAADVAEALGARHIYPGNVYNFGAGMPRDLTVATPFAPTTLKGRLRVDIETLLRARAEAGKLRTVVIRAGDFVGEGARTSWMAALVAKDARKGVITVPGGFDVVHAWAYLPDLAETIVRVAEVEAVLPDYAVFHFENHNVTARQVAAAVSATTGRKTALRRMPKMLFSLFGLFSPFMKATVEMLYLWDVPHALRDSDLKGVIGEVPRTPLKDVMARFL